MFLLIDITYVRSKPVQLIGAAGLSSAISTFLLLSYIAVCRLPPRIQLPPLINPNNQWYSIFSKTQEQPIVRGIRSFSRSALGAFFICLLLCDFVQGAAFAVNFKWAAHGRMYLSPACTAQGAYMSVCPSMRANRI
jgi:hypothetical protein